jgi:hypothetical protein
MTVVLVACATKKQPRICAAQDLYVSQLFRLSRRYAEQAGDRWYILSAQYGLLSPETEVLPYNATLKDAGVEGRHRWAAEVWNQIRELPEWPWTRVHFLAGRFYREHLIPRLEATGCHIEIPLESLPIGKQIQRLQQLTSRPKKTLWETG